MKKKSIMYQTFKTSIFGTVHMKDSPHVPVVKIVNNHLVINDDCCDLRTAKDRLDPITKELTPSGVENILYAESFLTLHYGAHDGDKNTLFDFITVDCSGGNDLSPDVQRIKDMLCYDGLYLPLHKLEAIGYIPHSEAEIVELEGIRYIRYRTAMQSASENRQCKLTATTYKWDTFINAGL